MSFLKIYATHVFCGSERIAVPSPEKKKEKGGNLLEI